MKMISTIDSIVAFISIINNNHFYLETINVQQLENPQLRNGSYITVSHLKISLDEFKNRVILDSNLSSYDLSYFLGLINNSLLNFKEINIDSKNYFSQKDIKMFVREFENEEAKPLEILDKNQLLAIEEYCKVKYKVCTEMVVGIEKKLNNLPDSDNQKLMINISVADIALLFRLLDEEKLLTYKHKTEIYRHITSTLKTEKQDNISEASIKNKFLTPDSTAIRNLNILLTNLKIILTKI